MVLTNDIAADFEYTIYAVSLHNFHLIALPCHDAAVYFNLSPGF